MFSRIRKHLNIMCVLLISLTILLGIVFVGVISIDQYCEDNVLANVQSEEKLVADGLSSLLRNIGITIDSLEITLRYEADALVALQSGTGSIQPTVQGFKYDNCIAVISNTYYNVNSQTESSEIDFRKADWFQGAVRQKDGALYVSTPYIDDFDGKEYVAFAKYVKNGRYVIAICLTTDNLRKELSNQIDSYGYLINVNNDIVASRDGENIGVNVVNDARALPKGHDEVFEKIDDVSKKTIVETRAGDMYASKYTLVSGLKYVIVREEGKIVNKVSSTYLEVIIAVIIMIPIIICMFIIGQRYARRIHEIYSNKCEFIEGLALEMRIPLESIRLASNDLLDYGLDDNVKKQVDTILESTKAIAFDLNSAYDYSKLAIRELVIDNAEYSFGRILKNVEKVVHSDMQKNNIYFDPIIKGNSELKLYGDHRKIEEIIINTVKYCASQTIEGGIELKVMYADLTPDSVNVMLIIKDTGVGMNDTELPIFVEGLKAYSNGIEIEHSGIGLEMVKQLLRLLNGKISVDSTKNVGSVFTIMIPQKIVIGDDSKWENEDVRTSTELTELYSHLDTEHINYSYITKEQGVAKGAIATAQYEVKENKMNKIEVQNEVKLHVEQDVKEVQDINEINHEPNVKDVNIQSAKETKSQVTSERKEVKLQAASETKEVKLQATKEAKEIKEAKMQATKEAKEARLQAAKEAKEARLQAAKEAKEAKSRAAKESREVQERLVNEKGTNTLFGKKINRLEDMIPQPELIDDLSMNNNMENNNFDNGLENNAIIEAPSMAEFNSTLATETKNNDVKADEVKPVRASVTQYLDDDNNDNQEVSDTQELDIQEQQMRQQMEAQANGLYEQIANREINSIYQQTNVSVEPEPSKQVSDRRIELLKNTLGQGNVDVDTILGEYGNDIDSYEKTLIEFYEYSKGNANKIITMWNQKQFNEYFSAIDTIKAGANAIGAYDLVVMLDKQLQKGRDGDLQYVAASIKDTFAKWKNLLALIAQFEKVKNTV